MAIKIFGSGISPYVRKVLVACEEKGVEYAHEDFVPFPKTPELLEKSPLGKVPFAELEGAVVPDSSAICAYLERKQPSPALYPSEPVAYARALWLEEYGDTKVTEVATTPFFQRKIRPAIFQEEADEAHVQNALTNELPAVADYLTRQLGDDDYLLGNQLTTADIAVCSSFVNMRAADEDLDGARWPQLAAYLERVLGRPSFKAAIATMPRL